MKTMNETDKMYDIFSSQAKLQSLLGRDVLPKKVPDMIRESALGIFTELGEALAVDKSWKTWKEVHEQYDQDDLKEEIADIWIFLVNYTLANNISWPEICEAIMKKQEKNYKRFL